MTGQKQSGMVGSRFGVPSFNAVSVGTLTGEMTIGRIISQRGKMTKPCDHETLKARIKIPVNEYVCDDCKEKLVLVIPQYGLMTPEEFEQFKRTQAMQIEAAKRRKSTGLVTPAEHQREQA